jgi:outer membrane protein assembly factor BamB
MKPMGNGKPRSKLSLFFAICLFLLVVLTGMSCNARAGYVAFTLSSGQCQARNASPVAGEQTLAIVVASGPNITICILRASDGTLLRHYDLNIHGSVIGQADGLLYVQNYGQQGAVLSLCAVHISDGVERWCQAQLKNYDLASITTDNGIIYVRPSDQTDNHVTAVNERNGQILWNFRTQADPAITLQPLIAISHGTVYMNAYQNLQAGSPTPITSTTQGPDPKLGVRSVCALQSSNGQQLWCKPFSKQIINAMAVVENTLYVRTVNSSSNYASIYALDSANGAFRWHFSLMLRQTSYRLPALVVAHGMVFTNGNADTTSYLSSNDQLYALRAGDGKQLWNISYESRIDLITATDKLLYIVTSSGALSALNILDGTLAWSHGIFISLSSYNFESTILVGPTVTYILMNAKGDPHLLALKANNASTIWEDKGCAFATSTPIIGTSTPAGNGAINRCYWAKNAGVGVIKLLLLEVDNRIADDMRE